MRTVIRLLLVTLVFVVGCATGGNAERSPGEMNAEPAPPVTFQPGDQLEVKFYQVPDLNDLVLVLPDGTINLQLVGQAVVAGKTPTEVRDELMTLYGTTQLRQPELAVIPRVLIDRRIYVGGEVNAPGMLPMPGQVSALEAIMEAGGFKYDTAEMSTVIVIRHRDGKRYGCSLDLRNALEGRNDEPFYLQQKDIVYVPPTTVYRFNLWIDQHINKIFGDVIGNFGFIWTYSTDTEESTIGIRPRF